jgi:hypothetical protein
VAIGGGVNGIMKNGIGEKSNRNGEKHHGVAALSAAAKANRLA